MRSLLLRLTLVLVLLFGAVQVPSHIGVLTTHAQSCQYILIDVEDLGDTMIFVFIELCTDGIRLIGIRVTELADGNVELAVVVQTIF